MTTLWDLIVSRHASKSFKFCEFSIIYRCKFYDYNKNWWLKSLAFSTSKIIYLVLEKILTTRLRESLKQWDLHTIVRSVWNMTGATTIVKALFNFRKIRLFNSQTGDFTFARSQNKISYRLMYWGIVTSIPNCTLFTSFCGLLCNETRLFPCNKYW